MSYFLFLNDKVWSEIGLNMRVSLNVPRVYVV